MPDNPKMVRLDRPTQTASARRERATEQAARGHEHRREPQEKVEGPFTSSLRIRLSRVSSSMNNEEAPKEVHVSAHEEVHVPAQDEVRVLAPVHVTPTYLGGPFDTSFLIYYSDHVARHVFSGETLLKSVNHARKIFTLVHPTANWFKDNIIAFGLLGLCCSSYNTISHKMHEAFVDRWHKETSYFHFSVG
ncbi:uncharacterized protein LOC131658096 [Vicia villosa]|uniref:uncharacterized protein LOC131658096 n=1 Tax=Vicia villosa TaxID=3911 RepID=UPI00273C7AF6|nr:uncharacterized protein LOC131658096 [Vicia villosa]